MKKLIGIFIISIAIILGTTESSFANDAIIFGTDNNRLSANNRREKNTFTCIDLARDYRHSIHMLDFFASSEELEWLYRSNRQEWLEQMTKITNWKLDAIHKLILMQMHGCKNLPTK